MLRLEATVDTKRISSTRDDLGILRWTWRVYNQRDEQVLEVEAINLFDLGTTGSDSEADAASG
jgi:acyl dehydratase